MRRWRIEDSAELYNISGWGLKYFSINDKGHVQVTPREGSASVDLRELMDELQLRDVTAPVLVRFPDILDNRIEKISKCFQLAADEYGYTAKNFIIYPIKVNQMRPVVEEIVSHGKKFNIGLEAGSKPELPALIAKKTDSDSLTTPKMTNANVPHYRRFVCVHIISQCDFKSQLLYSAFVLYTNLCTINGTLPDNC